MDPNQNTCPIDIDDFLDDLLDFDFGFDDEVGQGIHNQAEVVHNGVHNQADVVHIEASQVIQNVCKSYAN
ncbi:unnamed protein product [Arabis nemorensis]|uniref:Uncharacterized protein n=1 Tax=Arabis nemorensis TaxID=586526 RepID=A0A565BNH5_9BRAS|nr:unnamed protein product [Arabis nemorensis]